MDRFGICIDLPDDRLCPPVPNRMSYLKYLHTLIHTTDEPTPTTVLDIGAGASCVYPLLGFSMYGWRFIGSDIDSTAVQWARRNIATNHQETNIRIVQVQDSATMQTELSRYVGSVSTEASRSVDSLGTAVWRLIQLNWTTLETYKGPVRAYPVTNICTY
jgi:hypothetical protein